MDAQELVEAGLTKNQAEAYIALLRQPGLTAGAFAKKITVDRSFAYNILKSLEQKGLASHAKRDSRRVYMPANPEILLRDIDEKRKLVAATVEKLNDLKREQTQDVLVEIYEGDAAISGYVKEVLESPYFYTLGGGKHLDEFMHRLRYRFPHIMKELAQKKIDGKIVTSEDNLQDVKEVAKKFAPRIRTLKGFSSHVSFVALKDKVVIWSSAKKPFSIMIQGPEIAEAMRFYFDFVWEKAKKIE